MLDFDDIEPVSVKLGGQNFELRPQSAKIVQQVLEFASVDESRTVEVVEGAEGEDPRKHIRSGFSNWEDTVTAVAIMLGVLPGTDGYSTNFTHLQEHLSPARAIAIYERWWEVNEIDDFLGRGMKVLMPLDTLKRLKAFQATAMARMIDQMVAEAKEEEPRETAETETTETVH